MERCVKNRVASAAKRVCVEAIRSKLTPARRITTSGFKAFSWYVRLTMTLVVVAMLPFIVLKLASMPLLGIAQFSWAKVVSRRRWKEGERVRRGLYHRLFGPSIKQMFSYVHVFASNMAFFTLAIAAWLKACNPATDIGSAFKLGAVMALIPCAALFVLSVVYHYLSRFTQLKDPLPLKYSSRLLWRSPEKTYDKVEDSVLNLMFREQVQDAVSMSSLSRLDKQLLFGMPTAIVACMCYLYDLCTGQEQVASEIRENAKKHLGGVSTEFSRGAGLFRA